MHPGNHFAISKSPVVYTPVLNPLMGLNSKLVLTPIIQRLLTNVILVNYDNIVCIKKVSCCITNNISETYDAKY